MKRLNFTFYSSQLFLSTFLHTIISSHLTFSASPTRPPLHNPLNTQPSVIVPFYIAQHTFHSKQNTNNNMLKVTTE